MFGKIVFKDKELLLLSSLRRNSRATLTELSKSIGIPISTIHEKLKHRTQSVIKKNTCMLDYSKLGFNTIATMLLKVKKEEKDSVAEYLKGHFNVNSIYKINSDYDFMIEVIFTNIKDMEDFVEDLEDRFRIRGKQVFYIIDEIAKEQFLDSPEKLKVLHQ